MCIALPIARGEIREGVIEDDSVRGSHVVAFPFYPCEFVFEQRPLIGEVSAVIGAIKILNDGISTLREGAGNAQSLQSLVGKWGQAQEKYNEVERSKAGILDYKSALAMESAKRQLQNFDRQFHDICLMQNQGDLYTAVKTRMEEARVAHEAEVRRIKKRRREMQRYMKMGGTVIFGWVAFMSFVYFFVWMWENRLIE